MKKISEINLLLILVFSLLLTSAIFGQEKPADKNPDQCKCNCENCATTALKCTEDCTEGCKNAKTHAMKTKEFKHVCTDECHEKGCDFVKAKEARAALDVNQDGFIYECPMKCEASDVEGECSKCGMKLKKVSVKDS